MLLLKYGPVGWRFLLQKNSGSCTVGLRASATATPLDAMEDGAKDKKRPNICR